MIKSLDVHIFSSYRLTNLVIMQKTQKNFLFPIFLECKEWTLDPFWQEIFVQCAMGKFPKELKLLKDGTLMINNGKLKEIISVQGDSLNLFKIMMDVFRVKLGILSDRDIKKQKQSINIERSKVKQNVYQSWKDIKQKNTKDILILNFIVKYKQKFKLSDKESKNLYSMIKLALLFKTLTAEDIIVKDGKIDSIGCLSVDTHKNCIEEFSIKINELPSKPDKSQKKSKIVSKSVNQVVARYVKERFLELYSKD